MGVDSGLPDFRGHEGFWRAYPAYRGLGLGFADLAGPVHFVDDPPLAWGFYGHRMQLYRTTVPHSGFEVLLRWSRQWPTRVFTSNVDGQFQRAGFDACDVAEVHGTIHHLQCLAGGGRQPVGREEGCGQPVWPADGVEVTVDEATMRAAEPLPSCPRCGALARPNILMFGDLAWDDREIGPRLDRHVEWLRGLRRDGARLAVVELGAGTAVPTVRRQSELAAASSGALVRINVREPEVRHGHGVGLAAPAATTLAALDTALGHPGT